MYGIILSAIAEVIKERYGLDFWKLINPTGGDSIGDTDGTFISRLFYDDELTYQLINNAERILRCEKYGQLSQLFGERFFELVCDSGYESILRLLGENLKDFLDNLDSFHTHLSTTYSRMRPPSFRCSHVYEEEDDLNYNLKSNQQQQQQQSSVKTRRKIQEKLILHYYSDRAGLEGIVMGMVKAAARELFGINVELVISKLKLLDQGIDHTEFIITIIGPYKPRDQKSLIDETTKQLVAVDSKPLDSSPKNTYVNEPKQQQQQQQQLLRNIQLYEDEAFTYKNVKQLSRAAKIPKVSPLVFAQALPFHLIFDRSLVIRQAGTSILRVIPALNTKKNVKLAEVMNLLEPKCLKGKVSFQNILKYKNSLYVFRPDEKQVISGGHRHLHNDYLRSLKGGDQTATSGLTLKPESCTMRQQPTTPRVVDKENSLTARSINTVNSIDESLLPDCNLPEADIDKYIVKLMGQMIYMKDKDLMLFVCSPSVANLDDLNNTGLFLSDIPLHDATRDLVLLSEQFEAEYKVQENLTTLTEQLNVMKNELEEEKKKTDRLLYSVLPPTVANELRNNRPVPAKRYQNVSILFSGIVGFSEFCARNSDSSGAIRIVNLLNKIYTTFDVLTEPKRNPFVYKVETVGDKYMAVSGLPEACDSHARHINKLALDIQDLAKTIKLEEYTGTKTRQNNQSELTQMDQCDHLRVTIGVHCGEVVTGVIGKRTPRYCLFGNTVNLTSRCETTGKKGSINVSQDVYNLCTKDSNNFDSSFEFTLAGQVNMKGKTEPMRMWYLTRRTI